MALSLMKVQNHQIKQRCFLNRLLSAARKNGSAINTVVMLLLRSVILYPYYGLCCYDELYSDEDLLLSCLISAFNFLISNLLTQNITTMITIK